MSDKPTAFFEDWDKAKSSRKNKSLGNYQQKILKKYFPETGEILNSIWNDEAVEDKLEEVKYRSNNPILKAVDIRNYPHLYIDVLYRNMPNTQVWKDIMPLISEHGEAGIIFPVYKMGNYILHNFPRQPDDVLKKPRIIWPGNSGSDLTLQKLDVFLIEHKSGD